MALVRRLAFVVALTACGGDLPTPKADLMADTTVGKNRCQAGQALERPFIIEWDATDIASFESKASRDVVFVKIDGCNLKVLDCRDDGIPGKYGAYDTVRWTSGVVEGFSIKNEGDLYAKLPLGATTLAGNLKGGNELQLKYFVSGSRPALRSLVYKNDVASNPLCASATHFVAGYDLGAFDLGSAGHSSASATVDAKAASGGGNLAHTESHLRAAGSLPDCTKDSAKELSRCRVPIRLALRPLAEGSGPAQPAAAAPKGGIFSEEYGALTTSAGRKMQLRDGKGCLDDLDRAEAIAKPSGNNLDSIRSLCEMLVGRCDDGRRRYRAWLASSAPAMTPEQVDAAASQNASQYCEGKEKTPLERVRKANSDVIEALHKKDVARCAEVGKVLADAFPKIPATTDATEKAHLSSAPRYAADCLARYGGDCALGTKLWTMYVDDTYAANTPEQRAATIASYQCPANGPAAAPAPKVAPQKAPKKKKP